MKIIHRLSPFLAVTAWLALGLLQFQSALHQHTSLPLLLAAESLLVGFRLLNRNKDENNPYPWYVRGVVLASAFFGPLLLRIEGPVPLTGTIIACAGLLLTLWALWSLGPSFGIAPADRGLVTHGPYRFIRHPMYAGALLATLVTVAWNPSIWNQVLTALIVMMSILRISLEERTIVAYSQYAQRVRWRLVPFLW